MTLMRNQRDFHLGDEMLMEQRAAPPRHGGQRTARRARGLVVGKMSYRWSSCRPASPWPEHCPPAARVRRRRRNHAGHGAHADAGQWPARRASRPLPPIAATVTIESLPASWTTFCPSMCACPTGPRSGRTTAASTATTSTSWPTPTKTMAASPPSRSARQWSPGGVGSGQRADAAAAQPAARGVTEVTLDFPPVGSHLLVRHARR